MPISEQLRALRANVGHDRLMLPAVPSLVFDDTCRVMLQKHGATRRAGLAPGASVEADEAPTDERVREIWEETGLFVEPSTWAPPR